VYSKFLYKRQTKTAVQVIKRKFLNNLNKSLC